MIDYDQSESTLQELHALHAKNIQEKGGIAKPKSFFNAIQMQFEQDSDYRIYTARTKNGELVSALMLLYFKDIVEYFEPATAKSWLSSQPLSGLIFRGMYDAIIERNAKIWNWGGTWLSQDGVYRFKSRWGTTDHPYRYYTRIFSGHKGLESTSETALLKGYPWFYTIPFSKLKRKND
jgi:lipid II:glycine glycyltransferase (peptidoglycan interpeptide bridge formation enzyme)